MAKKNIKYSKIELNAYDVAINENWKLQRLRDIFTPRFCGSLNLRQVSACNSYRNLIENQLNPSPILLCYRKVKRNNNYWLKDLEYLPCLIAHRMHSKKISAWIPNKNNVHYKDYYDFINMENDLFEKYGLHDHFHTFEFKTNTKDYFKHCCLFVDVNKLDLPLPSWLVKSVCENPALALVAADWLEERYHPTAALFREYPDVGAMFCRKLNGENVKVYSNMEYVPRNCYR